MCGCRTKPFSRLLLLWILLVAKGVSAQTNEDSPPRFNGIVPDLGSWKVGRVQLGTTPVGVGSPDGSIPFDANGAQDPTTDPAKSGRGEFVAAPVPFHSPTFGFGLAGGLAYIYRPDGQGTNSPPWITGGGAFYSENGSWGALVGHKMNLGDDRWRLLGFAGYANLRYNFFGIGDSAGQNGRSVAISQDAYGGVVEGLYRVSGHFYAGLRYTLAHVGTSFDASSLPPQLVGVLEGRQLDTILSAPSLRVQYDTRDNQFNPTRGWFVDGDAAFYDKVFGSDFTYQAVSVLGNRYFQLADRQVLAFSTYGRFSFGDVPFFGLSMFGTKNQLRGYTAGRYQDRMLLAGQAEYRLQLTSRWGVVAFGGIGAVAPTIQDFRDTTPLPSGGFGLRYMLAKANKVNFRVDLAWGRDGRAVYVGVGEAF